MSEKDSVEVEASVADVSEKRFRSFTEKGFEIFKSTCAAHDQKLLSSFKRIEELATLAHGDFANITTLNDLHAQLHEEYNRFCKLLDDFRDFLNRTNTAESKHELVRLEESADSCIKLADKAFSHMISIRQSLTEADVVSQVGSVKSSKSKSSHVSSRVSMKSGVSRASSKLSEMVAIKRAKAEAARAKLEFAEEEANLKKQQAQLAEQEKLAKATAIRKKAELEADLQLLNQKSEAAAAEAEANVLEALGDGDSSNSSLFGTAQNVQSIDPLDRTRQYVKQQSEFYASQSVPNLIKAELADPGPTQIQSSYTKPIEEHVSNHQVWSQDPMAVKPDLNVNAPVFHPNQKLTKLMMARL